MKTSLRRAIYRYLAIASFAGAFCVAAAFWVTGELYFRVFYRAAEARGVVDIKERLRLFDSFVSLAEYEARIVGKKALMALGERFKSDHDIRAVETGQLALLARDLGVSEIFLIDKNGIVVSTTMEADLGLNLFSIGPRMARDLAGLFGTGEVADQRLSHSVNTGALGVYQYYSPPGSTILIEVSIRIRDLFRAAYPDHDYESYSNMAMRFDPETEPASVPLEIIDVVAKSGANLWSVFREGLKRNEYLDMCAKATAGRVSRRLDGDTELVVFPLAQDRAGTDLPVAYRYAILRVDHSPTMRFRIFAFCVALAACVVAALVSVGIAGRGFVHGLAGRLEGLEQAMRRIPSDDCCFEYRDQGGDEITSIAESAGSLVGRLNAEIVSGEERARELASALKEQLILQREIHHRVKNNMQIILSLVGLQLGERNEAAVAEALGAMRTRFYAMSLVLDRLYSRADVERLDLDDFFNDFVFYLGSSRTESSASIELRADGGGLYLSADVAVPIGLIVGELVTNALRHAFVGRERGSVTVEARPSREGFTLTVQDDGVGGTIEVAGEGVGLTVVRALAAQLGSAPETVIDGGRTVRIAVVGGVAAPPVSAEKTG
jgi:two-component sensor histidine kinase